WRAQSLPAKGVSDGVRAIPRRDAGGLVPGRAAEPGLLVLRAAPRQRGTGREPEARLCRPPGIGFTGRRLLRQALRAAEGAHRERLRRREVAREEVIGRSASQSDRASPKIRAA